MLAAQRFLTPSPRPATGTESAQKVPDRIQPPSRPKTPRARGPPESSSAGKKRKYIKHYPPCWGETVSPSDSGGLTLFFFGNIVFGDYFLSWKHSVSAQYCSVTLLCCESAAPCELTDTGVLLEMQYVPEFSGGQKAIDEAEARAREIESELQAYKTKLNVKNMELEVMTVRSVSERETKRELVCKIRQ